MANPFQKLAQNLEEAVADVSSLDHVVLLKKEDDGHEDLTRNFLLLSSQQNYNGDMVRVLSKESEQFSKEDSAGLHAFHSEMLKQSQRFRLALIQAIGEIL